MKTDKKTQGKKNRIRGKKARASGARFELKVRHDLEEKGWIVDKWSNTVEIKSYKSSEIEKLQKEGWKVIQVNGVNQISKLIPAKHKFRGPGIPMAIGTGFPDFIAFTKAGVEYAWMYPSHEVEYKEYSGKPNTNVIGVEVKSNGYLDKTEKEKCVWLLENNIFSKILIASKGKKRGEIIYKEFK